MYPAQYLLQDPGIGNLTTGSTQQLSSPPHDEINGRPAGLPVAQAFIKLAISWSSTVLTNTLESRKYRRGVPNVFPLIYADLFPPKSACIQSARSAGNCIPFASLAALRYGYFDNIIDQTSLLREPQQYHRVRSQDIPWLFEPLHQDFLR